MAEKMNERTTLATSPQSLVTSHSPHILCEFFDGYFLQEALADFLHESELDPAVFHMLALGHISGEDVGVDVSLRGEGEGFQDVLEAARGAAGGEAEELGALGDEVHADRGRFAVGDRFVIVAAAALDGSADGVSEVEETALFLAGGVDFYIVRLDGNAAADDFRQHAQELHVGIGFFEKLEELFVTDAAEFHGFAHAIVQVFSGEGLGHARIDIDGARLIEGADEILARGDVECDLAADGAPDL